MVVGGDSSLLTAKGKKAADLRKTIKEAQIDALLDGKSRDGLRAEAC